MSYSLIKWISGSDTGKYTVLETGCVKDFNYDKYVVGDIDESYIVEWREGKKPLGGYPVYDGQIIQVSDNKVQLERLIDNMVTACSTAPITSKITTKPCNSKGKGTKVSLINVSDRALLSDITNIQNRNISKRPAEDTFVNLQNENKKLKMEIEVLKNNSEFLNNENIHKNDEIEKLTMELTNLKETIIAEIPKVLASCKDLIEKFLVSANEGAAGRTLPGSQSILKTELYPGSPFLVDSTALLQAKKSKSLQGFVGDMMSNLFPTEVLLNSNYKGGKNKFSSNEEARPALDSYVMKELYRAAESYYPNMHKQDFGKAVNQKIANLRYRAKLVHNTSDSN